MQAGLYETRLSDFVHISLVDCLSLQLAARIRLLSVHWNPRAYGKTNQGCQLGWIWVVASFKCPAGDGDTHDRIADNKIRYFPSSPCPINRALSLITFSPSCFHNLMLMRPKTLRKNIMTLKVHQCVGFPWIPTNLMLFSVIPKAGIRDSRQVCWQTWPHSVCYA